MSIRKYIQESVREINSVTWPTRKQAIRITIIVFIFMIFTAIFLGIVDQLLTVGIRGFL